MVFENLNRCGLVDDVFLMLRFFASFAELIGGGDGGEALIDVGEGDGAEFGFESFAKSANFLGAAPFGAVHAKGKAEDDGLDFSLGDDLENAVQRVAFSAIDGFDWVGTDGKLVGCGETDAGVAMID